MFHNTLQITANQTGIFFYYLYYSIYQDILVEEIAYDILNKGHATPLLIEIRKPV